MLVGFLNAKSCAHTLLQHSKANALKINTILLGRFTVYYKLKRICFVLCLALQNLAIMTSKVVYMGNLRTNLTHLYSGTEIITDAPLDNQGLAQSFSPSDLAATSLATCMMTIMGIKARDMNLQLEGTELEVTKVMAANPRRISEIHINIKFPKNNFTQEVKTALETAARNCPVAKSLHPDILQEIVFNF
jgi:putative redox protein